MDPDRSLSDAATQPSSPVPEPDTGRTRYVEPAPLMDVMIDQLEYLVAHKSAECPPNCLACERLEQVEGWLMLPFRASVRP
jgi:hypothetical protein